MAGSEPLRGPPLLTVHGLQTVIETDAGRICPVDGVEFSLWPGETVAIVGESGSGKSMTALSLMGLLPRGVAKIVGGSARLGDKELTALTSSDMRELRSVQMSYMPQDPSSALNPSLTIGYQVMEPLLLHRLAEKDRARQQAVELLRKMGIPNLPHAMHSYPHQLSGGMRQRVLLAMALIAEPKVLIADEPTTAVDVTTQEQIIDLLAAVQRDTGLAIILITHDLGVVARIATRVLVMYAGRSVEYGSADEVFEHPTHPYTEGLLRSVEFDRVPPQSLLSAIQGVPPHLGQLPPGCAFQPRCPYAIDECTQTVPRLERLSGSDVWSACLLAQQGIARHMDPEYQ